MAKFGNKLSQNIIDVRSLYDNEIEQVLRDHGTTFPMKRIPSRYDPSRVGLPPVPGTNVLDKRKSKRKGHF